MMRFHFALSLLSLITASRAAKALDQALLTAQPSTASAALLDAATKAELLSLHRSLVEVESISGNEEDVGQWLAAYLRERNFTVELQEVDKHRYNLLAYPGAERKTKILVSSHIDTVRVPRDFCILLKP